MKCHAQYALLELLAKPSDAKQFLYVPNLHLVSVIDLEANDTGEASSSLSSTAV